MGRNSFQVWVVALIFYATIVNYFNRIAISYAILPIERDLDVTNAQFGWIAAGFTIGYFCMTFPSGILVDRFGSIRIWTIMAIFWSLIAICMTYAPNAQILFFLLILLGAAEAVHFPALLKTIADWLEPRFRTRSLALGLMGVPFASVIGAPFLSVLISYFGWRRMFFILGILGFVWALIWPIVFWRKKNPHCSLADIPFEPKEKIPWKSFFSSKCFLSNCAIYFTFGYALFFGLNWLPGYLQISHGLSLTKTGFFSILPWGAASVFIFLGGWISDFLYKKTKCLRIARSYPMIAALLGASFFFFLLTVTDSLSADLWLLSLGLGVLFFLNAPIYALNADLFPKHAATAQGIITSFFSLAGMISSVLTGYLVQKTGTFHAAIFFVSALTLLSALVAIFFQKVKTK